MGGGGGKGGIDPYNKRIGETVSVPTTDEKITGALKPGRKCFQNGNKWAITGLHFLVVFCCADEEVFLWRVSHRVPM